MFLVRTTRTTDRFWKLKYPDILLGMSCRWKKNLPSSRNSLGNTWIWLQPFNSARCSVFSACFQKRIHYPLRYFLKVDLCKSYQQLHSGGNSECWNIFLQNMGSANDPPRWVVGTSCVWKHATVHQNSRILHRGNPHLRVPHIPRYIPGFFLGMSCPRQLQPCFVGAFPKLSSVWKRCHK